MNIALDRRAGAGLADRHVELVRCELLDDLGVTVGPVSELLPGTGTQLRSFVMTVFTDQPSTSPPPTDKATAADRQKVSNGASTQNGENDVPDEVKTVLDANPPTWRWVLCAFGILAVGTGLSYVVWRLVKPADFMPSSSYAVYAGLFIMALAIERVLEPFSGLFVPTTKKKKATSHVMAAQAKLAQAAAAASQPHAATVVPVGQAQKDAAVAKQEFHRSQATRAVLMWATGSVLAMLLCASLGIFLLRSVETPSATSGSATWTSASSSTPSPGENPNRLLDLLVTGLVVGAGTKPLHDLIGQIQTSSGNSKASASSATANG